jgi:hypothetical protein
MTSPVRIAVDSVLMVSPALARPCVAALASTSAPRAPSSGSSQSTGLRYTSSRTIATISSARSSSSVELPWTAVSAVTAAEPVTSARSPLVARAVAVPAARVIARNALRSAEFSMAGKEVTFAANSAARPSAERRSGPGEPIRPPRRATAERAEAAAARSPTVRPRERAKTTTAWSTSVLAPGASCCSSATRVDGADGGR